MADISKDPMSIRQLMKLLKENNAELSISYRRTLDLYDFCFTKKHSQYHTTVVCAPIDYSEDLIFGGGDPDGNLAAIIRSSIGNLDKSLKEEEKT